MTSMLGHLLVLIILFYVCGATTLTAPAVFSIGGLFDTFAVVNSNLSYVRQVPGSQYLAAFIMAIDEINNKTDGTSDNLLLHTKLKMVCAIGVNIVALYPPNNFINGAGRAYILRNKRATLIATVDGSVIDESTSASAQTLNDWGVLDVISRSTSADYAHADSFPTTLQNTPSKISEAYSLVLLTGVRYGIKNVAVFFNYDTKVGLDSTVAFQTNLGAYGVTLLGSFPIKTGQKDFSALINSAMATGCTVYAFFLDGNAAGQLLEQGYNAGLFREGTQIFATSTADLATIRSAFTPAGRLNEANIMKGFITTAPHPEYYFSTPAGQRFISRFRKLPPTIILDPVTKTRKCDQRLDDTNGLLYQSTKGLRDLTPVCLGFESFAAFNQNGSNIDPYTMYAYDAVYAIARAVDALLTTNSTKAAVQSLEVLGETEDLGHRSMHHDNAFHPPSLTDTTHSLSAGGLGLAEMGGEGRELATSEIVITAQKLHALMTSPAITFSGMATGETSFLGRGGTRVQGNVFKILNYQSSYSNSAYSKGELAFIGEYSDGTGWTLCGNSADMATMTSYCISQCSSPQYRNSDPTTVPSDSQPDIIKYLSPSFSIPLIFFSIVGLILLALSLAYVLANWNEKVIKRSQPVLHLIIFLGAFFGLVKVLLSTAPVTRNNCVAQLWLEHLCFRLMLRTLLLKLWRVHVIVNTSVKSVKRVIGLNTVLAYIGVDVAILLFFLTAITYSTSNEYNRSHGITTYDAYHLIKEEKSFARNQLTVQEFCAGPAVPSLAFIFNTMLLFFEAMYLLLFAYYIYLTRDLPSTIKAAGTAGKALLFSFFVVAFVAVFSITTHLPNDYGLFAVNASFLFIIIAGGISYFGSEIMQFLKPFLEALALKARGRKRVFLEEKPQPVNTHRKGSTVENTFMTLETLKDNDSEVLMMGILNKTKDPKERELMCHKQICHWRAMLALLTEDMIDGNGAYSNHAVAKTPVKVAPMI